MRSSIADYEVIQALPFTAAGQARYLCRSPERLGLDYGPVVITELAVDAAGWRDLAGYLTRLAGVGSDRLLTLYEVGPDLDGEGAGVYLASESAPGGSTEDPRDPLDTGDRIRAVAEAARGAHAMHEAGLAHGSIHSRAILLTGRGAVLEPPTLGRPAGEVARMQSWREVIGFDPALLPRRGAVPVVRHLGPGRHVARVALGHSPLPGHRRRSRGDGTPADHFHPTPGRPKPSRRGRRHHFGLSGRRPGRTPAERKRVCRSTDRS